MHLIHIRQLRPNTGFCLLLKRIFFSGQLRTHVPQDVQFLSACSSSPNKRAAGPSAFPMKASAFDLKSGPGNCYISLPDLNGNTRSFFFGRSEKLFCRFVRKRENECQRHCNNCIHNYRNILSAPAFSADCRLQLHLPRIQHTRRRSDLLF